MTTTTITPIVKQVTVPATPGAAFRRFTAEIGSWWPMSHSVGQEDATGLTMEDGVGGRVYETGTDGSETEWGRITGRASRSGCQVSTPFSTRRNLPSLTFSIQLSIPSRKL